MKKTNCLQGLGLLLIVTAPALSEVREVKENAFVIESVATSTASPAESASRTA